MDDFEVDMKFTGEKVQKAIRRWVRVFSNPIGIGGDSQLSYAFCDRRIL